MRSVILTILLVSTQLVSWNAAPLYLCVDEDGSFDLDLGPKSCHCRHSQLVPDSSGHEQQRRAAQESDRSQTIAAGSPTSPCDCLHFQVTVPWVVVTEPQLNQVKVDLSLAAVPFGVSTDQWSDTLNQYLLTNVSSDRVAALSLFDTVVLRC